MTAGVSVFLAAALIAGQAPAPPPLLFEVATIKPSKEGGGKGGLEVANGGLKMQGVTLKNLIAFAYDLRETQISGGPKWIATVAYDVLARPEHPAGADLAKTLAGPGTTAWERVRLRTQVLLAERFQLAIHTTSREVQGYALSPAKDGVKLKANAEGDERPPGTMRSRGRIDGRNGTMHMLCAVLTNWLGRPVVDRTGLTGGYDYKLEYAQDEEFGPSVFTALQDQLGLKLESTRAKIETITVDRAERPSAN